MNGIRGVATILLGLALCLGIFECGGGQKEERTEQKGGTETEEPAIVQEEETQSTGKLLSAREAHALARKAAAEWSSDAVLAEINTFPRPPQPDGRGSGWKFEFDSAEQGEKLEVHIRRGKVFQTMTGKPTKNDPVAGEWLDSPEAVRRAAGALAGCTGQGYWMGLSMSGNRPVWRIKCSEGAKQQAWVKLDAVTGEEIERWTSQ